MAGATRKGRPEEGWSTPGNLDLLTCETRFQATRALRPASKVGPSGMLQTVGEGEGEGTRWEGHPLQDVGCGARHSSAGRRGGGVLARPPTAGWRYHWGGGGGGVRSRGGGAGVSGGGAESGVLTRAGGEPRGGAVPGTPKAQKPEWLALTVPLRTLEALAILKVELRCGSENYHRAYIWLRQKNH